MRMCIGAKARKWESGICEKNLNEGGREWTLVHLVSGRKFWRRLTKKGKNPMKEI